MQRQIIHPASERLESPPQQGYVGDRLVWGTSGKNAYWIWLIRSAPPVEADAVIATGK
jgi:hypothetical protein